jgi:3-oxoacyl-[acyl-carrier-protein] synthase-1
MVLALPEAGRPDDDSRFGPAFIDALGAKSRCPIDLPRSTVVRAGHAGFAVALEIAAGLLNKASLGPTPTAVVVGGVDSYHHEGVLQWLDSEHRLHATGTENGMLPSEGAAFAILMRAGSKLPTANDRPLGRITAVRTARDESGLMGRPNLAEALTQVTHEIAAHSGPLPWVLTDLNGERHRNKEWMQVALRGSLAENAVQTMPAQLLGDVGAATGALYLAIATTYFTTGAAPARKAAIVLQSEGPERGAFLLEEVS